MAPLHLLRNIPPYINGEKTDVERFVQHIHEWARQPGTVGGSWTHRRPLRTTELKGGSVYYVAKGWTVFRSPFLGIERVAEFCPDPDPEWVDAWAIVYEPRVIMVASQRVHRLRGWRYLKPADVPPDI